MATRTMPSVSQRGARRSKPGLSRRAAAAREAGAAVAVYVLRGTVDELRLSRNPQHAFAFRHTQLGDEPAPAPATDALDRRAWVEREHDLTIHLAQYVAAQIVTGRREGQYRDTAVAGAHLSQLTPQAEGWLGKPYYLRALIERTRCLLHKHANLLHGLSGCLAERGSVPADEVEKLLGLCQFSPRAFLPEDA